MEFEKYHKLKRLGDEENKELFSKPDAVIVIQEKIDGGNFRFYIQNGKLIFGSRTRVLDETNENSKAFKRTIDYVKERIGNTDLSEYEGFIFYGEACHKHTISYDWDKIPPFLGFDIKDEEGYVSYVDTQRIFDELNLQMVPLITTVFAKDIQLPITDKMVPISEYALSSAQDQKAEGIVFKDYERQLFGKYVRDAFKEKNSAVFGGNPKYNRVDDTDNAEFMFNYCTNARIEKLILKRLDEGESMSMKLMGQLIKETYVDIIEEEWREILTSNWKLDFKNLRKSIALRVRGVLEQMIENNYIRGKE